MGGVMGWWQMTMGSPCCETRTRSLPSLYAVIRGGLEGVGCVEGCRGRARGSVGGRGSKLGAGQTRPGRVRDSESYVSIQAPPELESFLFDSPKKSVCAVSGGVNTPENAETLFWCGKFAPSSLL